MNMSTLSNKQEETFHETISVVVFRDPNTDTQTREVGWNKYITITEQLYRMHVLYNSSECPSGTIRQLWDFLPESQVDSVYIEEE